MCLKCIIPFLDSPLIFKEAFQSRRHIFRKRLIKRNTQVLFVFLPWLETGRKMVWMTGTGGRKYFLKCVVLVFFLKSLTSVHFFVLELQSEAYLNSFHLERL